MRLQIESVIRARGRGAAEYSEGSPPRAALFLDEGVLSGHLGEAVFDDLVLRAGFKFAPDFWELLPWDQRSRAQVGVERAQRVARAVWPKDADFLMYRKAMIQAYADLCRAWGKRFCRGWLVELLQGYGETEIAYTMRELVHAELQEPPSMEAVVESPTDEHPLRIHRGLRIPPELVQLVSVLRANGFDVWALSSSNQWAAEVVGKELGVDASRVVGIRCHIKNGRLVGDLLDPVPEGTGEAEALAASVGGTPALLIAGPGGEELLAYGKGGARIALDSGSGAFHARATLEGWSIQSSFPYDR